MSRPKPRVLLSHLDNTKLVEICDGGAYAVCYRGNPIKLKIIHNVEVSGPGPKYLKTVFPESGHALNLAEKLNRRFDTEEFEVFSMTPKRVIK